MLFEPTITWVPSGFSGYIWLDTKIVLKKKMAQRYIIHLSIKKILMENVSDVLKISREL